MRNSKKLVWYISGKDINIDKREASWVNSSLRLRSYHIFKWSISRSLVTNQTISWTWPVVLFCKTQGLNTKLQCINAKFSMFANYFDWILLGNPELSRTSGERYLFMPELTPIPKLKKICLNPKCWYFLLTFFINHLSKCRDQMLENKIN